MAEARRAAGVAVALYIVDIDGSQLIRLAGSEDFPETLDAPPALGPEIVPEGLPSFYEALKRRLPRCVAVPLWLRGRVIGLLLCVGAPVAALEDIAKQGAAALELANDYTDVIEAARRRKPTTAAAEVQYHLLPPRVARITGAQLAGALLPAYEVGGDWFDFVENRDGRGSRSPTPPARDPTAAGLSASALGALRAARRSGQDLVQAATTMDEVVRALDNPNFFVTARARALARADGHARVAQLRPSARLRRRPRGRLHRARGPRPSGARRRRRTAEPSRRASVSLSPADRLVLVTDGITDARSVGGGRFGVDGMRRAIQGANAPTAAATALAIQRAVTELPRPIRSRTTRRSSCSRSTERPLQDPSRVRAACATCSGSCVQDGVMAFRSVRPLPRPLRALAAALVLACLAALPGAARADCPGASGACPYYAASAVGQRAEGVLRFPQALAIGPDGSVYVADQGSHVVQVFGPDGVFRREVGIAGTRPGQLGAVGAIAVAGDGSLLVADGSNRIDRFDASGNLVDSWGRTGSGVGQFRFGAGGGNTAAAGGGLAVSGNFVYVADTGNDRVQRFTLDGGHGAVIVAPGQLANPRGIAVRGTRLLVADDQHHRLVVFDTGGHPLRAVGQNGSGPGQLNFPYGVATDSAGRVFVADDLNHRVVRFSSAPLYPYKGRWGSYGTRAGPARLPARPRGRPRRQRLRRQHRQRPHRRLRQGRRPAAVVRRLGPRAGAVRRADRRRRRRRGHPRGDRLGQRAPRAAQPRWVAGLLLGLSRAGADHPSQPGGGRLRRRRQRLRPRPSPLADRRLRARHGAAGAHDRLAGQRPRPTAQPLRAGHRRRRHARTWATRATSASRASARAAATWAPRRASATCAGSR